MVQFVDFQRPHTTGGKVLSFAHVMSVANFMVDRRVCEMNLFLRDKMFVLIP